MPELTRRHVLQIVGAVVVAVASSAGASLLGGWISETSEPRAVSCGDLVPYRVAYRLEGCVVDQAGVAYSYERDRQTPLAAFLPLRDARTGDFSGIVLRTTDPAMLAWTVGAEPDEAVSAYLGGTSFRAGRTPVATDEREVPRNMWNTMELNGRTLDVLDAGDTAMDWWLLFAGLLAVGLASLGAVPLTFVDARRQQRRHEANGRSRQKFDETLAEGRRHLGRDKPEEALEKFRRAYDAAHELELPDGRRIVKALIGAARAREAAGRVEESRETLTRALSHVRTLRPQDKETRALELEASRAIEALSYLREESPET